MRQRPTPISYITHHTLPSEFPMTLHRSPDWENKSQNQEYTQASILASPAAALEARVSPEHHLALKTRHSPVDQSSSAQLTRSNAGIERADDFIIDHSMAREAGIEMGNDIISVLAHQQNQLFPMSAYTSRNPGPATSPSPPYLISGRTRRIKPEAHTSPPRTTLMP